MGCAALGPDGLERHADVGSIIYLNAIKGESPAAERLRSLLADAYGTGWSTAKQAELLEQVGYSGKTLKEWLHNGFFGDHCKRFQQRPFIWHIWDGVKDGFSALVNYHKLDRANLGKLTYTYLGDWITRQKAEARKGATQSWRLRLNSKPNSKRSWKAKILMTSSSAGSRLNSSQ